MTTRLVISPLTSALPEPPRASSVGGTAPQGCFSPRPPSLQSFTLTSPQLDLPVPYIESRPHHTDTQLTSALALLEPLPDSEQNEIPVPSALSCPAASLSPPSHIAAISASELSLADGRDRPLRRLDPGMMPLPDTAAGLEWSSLVNAAKAYEGGYPPPNCSWSSVVTCPQRMTRGPAALPNLTPVRQSRGEQSQSLSLLFASRAAQAGDPIWSPASWSTEGDPSPTAWAT